MTKVDTIHLYLSPSLEESLAIPFCDLVILIRPMQFLLLAQWCAGRTD